MASSRSVIASVSEATHWSVGGYRGEWIATPASLRPLRGLAMTFQARQPTRRAAGRRGRARSGGLRQQIPADLPPGQAVADDLLKAVAGPPPIDGQKAGGDLGKMQVVG